MLLKNLIKFTSKKFDKINVVNLSLDSRKVKKGDLFFALEGKNQNGDQFLEEAKKKGAVAIVCGKRTKVKNLKIPQIKVKNVKKTLVGICKKFYKKKPKNIIAITGTNGKSSVADFFHQILFLNHIPVASIGTLGIKRNNIIKKTNLTSLDIISLHKNLTNLKKSNIDNVIVEASSHGLDQGRLDGINFKAGVFTNFSQDHLDYHKTMNKYLEAKKLLFSKLIKKNKFLITDKKLKVFPVLKKIANRKKINIKLINENKIIREKINLIGLFQIKNLSMSIIAAKLCGLKDTQINKILKKIKSVDGRLELIRTLPNKTKVYLDYAHTPDALLTVIKTLKKNYNRKIRLVFGCGGERDIKKRRLMALIAKKYSHKIYITDDNPRNESAKKIRKTLISHLNKGSYLEIPDRIKAIKKSLKESSPLEIILIAGKGHEMNQDYGNKIIKLSDKNIINNTSITNNNYDIKKINSYYNSKVLNKILKNKAKYFFQGVSINSKKVVKNNLFVAIKGKNKDGDKFASEALNKGANFCIVSKKLKNSNKKFIKVSNTFEFLNKLALLKRNETEAKIIAVTGSAGKTTVKTIISKILSRFGKTCSSQKSYNNHYGVPLSLSNLEKDHKYGVFEIGMSKKGEIHQLSKIVRPDIGIITNVAEAHIENFKNLKGIASAKSEIINNIKKNGFLIINRDDKFFQFFKNKAKKKKLNYISFGFSNKADIHIKMSQNFLGKNGFKIKVFKEEIFLKTKNNNILNILITIAILKILNLNISKIINILGNFLPVDGRGKRCRISRYKVNFNIIDESYNANPLSMKNAIENLSKLNVEKSKKYVLIGDMLELGKKSAFYHKNLSKIINKTDIDKVFVYGKNILETYKHLTKDKRGNILQNKNDFDLIFSNTIKKNDYLMIKGSNSTGLNKLVNNCIKGLNNVI